MQTSIEKIIRETLVIQNKQSINIAVDKIQEYIDKLKLEQLKEIKQMFDLHSDSSNRCNGYNQLCRMIEEL